MSSVMKTFTIEETQISNDSNSVLGTIQVRKNSSGAVENVSWFVWLTGSKVINGHATTFEDAAVLIRKTSDFAHSMRAFHDLDIVALSIQSK